MSIECGAGEAHQQAFQPAERRAGIHVAQAQPLLYIFVEVFQKGLAGVEHGVGNLAGQIELQLLEGGMDGLGVAAGLVDFGDAAFEIDA